MHRRLMPSGATGIAVVMVLCVPALQPPAGALPAALPAVVAGAGGPEPGTPPHGSLDPLTPDPRDPGARASGIWGTGHPNPDRWAPPASPARILAPFRAPEVRWAPGHRGIDLAADPGQEVRAVGTGQVTFAGPVAGRPVLSIDHGGLRTTYEPVSASVVPGQWVHTGDPVGTIGTGTGHCGSGDCLHLGLRRGQEYLDPLLLWSRTRTRLSPWAPAAPPA